jgi:hypothetical protein
MSPLRFRQNKKRGGRFPAAVQIWRMSDDWWIMQNQRDAVKRFVNAYVVLQFPGRESTATAIKRVMDRLAL